MGEEVLSVAELVKAEHIVKRYGETVALDGVSLSVREGERFALLGPNGAGKTTMLHILSTILKPDEGTAVIGGFDVVKRPMQARRNVGIVFQQPSLDDRLTVFENLDFHGRIYRVPGALRRQRIEAMLELVELADWKDALVRSLSGGMKRRVEIARSLIHDPKLLFLDEPTVGLDPQSRARIWEYMEVLQAEYNLTVIVTTHYLEEVEGCETVCILDHGRVLAVGSPRQLKDAYGRNLLRVRMKDAAAERRVAEKFPDVVRRDDELELHAGDERFVSKFMEEFGQDVRGLTVVGPSLEGVFLSLTGREIRDGAAGARERLYAFGMKGGEHTR